MTHWKIYSSLTGYFFTYTATARISLGILEGNEEVVEKIKPEGARIDWWRNHEKMLPLLALFDAELSEAEEDDEMCTTEEESSGDEFEIVFD